MADPTPYAVTYSFSNFQANSPDEPLPAPQLDNELANVATVVAGVITALKDVRRSDGKLKNGLVTVESMSVGVLAALSDLDETQAGEIDAAIEDVRTDLEADLATGLAGKADVNHTHAANTITVSAISGIVGADVQAVLAELRALAPQTGDLKLSMNPTAPSGWVACNDGTIGDGSSGASTRANADTAALYSLLWNSVSDTYAPVTSGRGASAAADFAAHKPIALTKMLGRALALAGGGSGLTSRALGQTLGEETHLLSIGEMPSHNHGGNTGAGTPHGHNASKSGGGTVTDVVTTGAASSAVDSTTVIKTESAHTHPISSQGGGAAHNIMQPTAFVSAFLKL